MVRYALFVVASIIVCGCATNVPRIKPKDVDTILDPVAVDTWRYPIAEHADQIVPLLFDRAKERGIVLKAVARTQHGFHSFRYSLLVDSDVRISSFFWGEITEKGTIPYSDDQLEAFVSMLEDEEKCYELTELHDGLSGDFIVYRSASSLRACVEEIAFFGGEGDIREFIWTTFDSDTVNWTYGYADDDT